ncbi:MAG: alpha/beta fold hydrolase [Spirochaetes bacterium]|nr:alpha/beta fold hydrolase [Spirochaetota bacterium]
MESTDMAYYNLIDEPQMNFTVNRILTYGERAARLDEVRELCGKIRDFDSWYEGWNGLAARAEREGRLLHSAYYFRMAEFFLADDREEKDRSYGKCKDNFRKAIAGNGMIRLDDIPFRGTTIPAMRICPPGRSRAVILLHGGYDSYMEEFFLTARDISEQGFTIIMFEGPGQGTALKNGLKFSNRWEEPVSAVLDHYGVESAAIIGISWGGYLAPRAAAFEPRIRQVVSYDVFFRGIDVIINAMPRAAKAVVRVLFSLRMSGALNRLVERARKKKPLADWGMGHGMYITGTRSPYDFFREVAAHDFGDIGGRITQDILLLAGDRDHLVPPDSMRRMKNALRNARSITTRTFTVAEGGEQHCQVGNIELAVSEIVSWLDRFYPP